MTARVLPALPGDPTRIGPYRIVGRLGSGGMGTVHAALDGSGRRLAVKVVHPAQAEDEEFRARFRREVALTSRVSGPCLVPVLAADCDTERPWLATAYIPGPTLQRYVTAHGPVEGATLHALAVGTAAALAAVHEAGVIHRDIKPGNVILSPDGPRLLDFGIAHALDGTSVTRTGVLTGTPGWISPEQYRTGAVSTESDVFSWGALIAYAGTGRHPFGTGAPDAVAFRVMSQDPDLSGLPDDLRLVLTRALAKEPEDRPAAPTLREDCVRLLEAQDTHVLPRQGASPTPVDDLVTDGWHPVPLQQAEAWPAPGSSGRARRFTLVGASAIGLSGVVAGAVFAFPPQKEPASRGDRTSPTTTVAPAASASSSPLGTVPSPAATVADDRATAAAPPAEPQPAYTRSDRAEPSLQEWSDARDAMTASERKIAASLSEETSESFRRVQEPPDGLHVTFNPEAQTMFLTMGPLVNTGEEGLDHTDLRRSIMFAGCTQGNHKLRTDLTWPYGRVVVVHRESMASPVVSDYREVVNIAHCRV
ncbi:protein kinase [Streptomyces sp. NPDC005955]|uniref:serine/threonine protein kinase n=1 Tax=Streptomyces sp. NPDC005955 TaxID=3364738 RepID=UPI0036B462AB